MGEDMRENAILTFTSHSKRLPLVDEVFRSHAENAENAGMRICLALQEDSVPAMTPYQRSLVDSGKIELLTIGKDHGSNTKWTLCRTKYPDATMVVVDDDIVYDRDTFRYMLGMHRRLPGAFLCRAARCLTRNAEGGLNPFDAAESFQRSATPLWRCDKLGVGCKGFAMPLAAAWSFPEHWAACLYPPGFPRATPDELEEARTHAFHADDVYVGVLLNRYKIASVMLVDMPACAKRWCNRDSEICKVSLVVDSQNRFGDRGAVTREALAHFAGEFHE